MAFFSYFPQLLYSTSNGVPNAKLATNIIAKVNFLSQVANNTSMYYEYSVKDGERAEDIANKMYKDPSKHWIVLMSNGIIDPQYDWPLSSLALADYILKKYSSITLALDPNETYPVNYTVGEEAYQGDSFDKASCSGEVIAYDSTNKKLTLKFPTEVFANAANVSGVQSGVTHKVVGITYNNDGFNWASNTNYYYQATETEVNSVDNITSTADYKVSSDSYNHATHTIISLDTNTTYSNTYSLNDGSTVSVETSVKPVSYYDYEIQANEDKRKIIIIKPAYVKSIENELIRLMGKI